MAVQIFGSAKSTDTRKAERWFSERRVSFQSINLKEKAMSPGELESVLSLLARETGSTAAALELLADSSNRDYASIAYLDDEDKKQKLLESPLLMRLPVVRFGKNAATVGYCPEVWKDWL